jgi:vacuolar protein 8
MHSSSLLSSSLTFHSQVKLMNLSSVIACSKLLTSDPRVLEQACGILRNLSTNNMAAGQICNEGAVEATTALLKNEDAKVVEQAAGTLRNVSANKDLRAAIVQAGALPLLIDLLSHVDEKVQEQAGVALHNLSDTVK